MHQVKSSLPVVKQTASGRDSAGRNSPSPIQPFQVQQRQVEQRQPSSPPPVVPLAPAETAAIAPSQPESLRRQDLQQIEDARRADVPLPKRRRKAWEWALIGLVATVGTFGGVGTAALLWLASLPPMPPCREVTIDSLDAQRLYCAQEKANLGKLPDLVAGIELIQGWSADRPLQSEAQRLISRWSDEILAIAQGQIARNNMTDAVAIAGQIPASSPRYGEAQQAIAHWQEQWQQGETAIKTAQVAMRSQDWSKASQQVLKLGYIEHAYWRLERSDQLSAQILVEKQAREELIQAQRLAKEGSAEALGEAIALLQKVPAQTYAQPDAKLAQQQWSRALVTLAWQQWQKGRGAEALAIAQKIPFDNNPASPGQDLVRLHQAQALANQSMAGSRQGWQPSLKQIWNLMEAMSAVRQVSPQSPFYQQAQVNQQNWQAQLQDVVQLQWASWIADWGQHPQLQFAIAQAQGIAPDHPRHPQAQALLGRWQKILERQQDQPYLDTAKRLAKDGTLMNLQLAIAQARRITLGRALRTEAQTWIAYWKKRVEAQEDQPILTAAQGLADRGNWAAAMETAGKIGPKRALYQQAQAAIALWSSELNPPEDRSEPTVEIAPAPYQERVYPENVYPENVYPENAYQENVPADSADLAEPTPLEDIASSESSVPIESSVPPESSASSEETAPEPTESGDSATESSGNAFEGYYDQRYFENSQ